MSTGERVSNLLSVKMNLHQHWKQFLSGCCLASSLLSMGDPAYGQSGYRGNPRFGSVTQTQGQVAPGAPSGFQPLPPALPADASGQPQTPVDGTNVAPGVMPADQNQHPDVIGLPGINSEVTVIQRRSQLVVTRSRIVQAAVADPSIIDIVQHSPTELSILGEGLGSTTLTIWFENNPDPLIYLVKTLRDPSLDDQARVDYGRLEAKIAEHFPNSKVRLYPVSGKIIVKGQANDSEEASQILTLIRGEIINQNGGLYGPTTAIEINNGYQNGRFTANDLASSNIINMLMIPGDFQVMLRVVIAELKRSELRNMAADLQVNINNGAALFTSALGGSPGTINAILDNADVSILLNALHTNQTGKILAEPSVVTLSGHDATILAGGEFAVPTVVGINGVGGQQTVFRGFGTSMVVTPTVLNKDLIRMRIRPEFSEINSNNTSQGGIPGLNTRRVDTTVELREGQTIVLGGLFSNQALTNNGRIPYISAIPLIGPTLFASKRSTQDETELLILVTPEIVRPMEADEVPPVPGHEVTVPDNNSLYLRGMTQGANDPNVYQLAPYGHGSGVGIPVGHGQHNPAPSSPGYAPAPTVPPAGNYGGGTPGMVPPPPGSEPHTNRYGNPFRRGENQTQPTRTGTSPRSIGNGQQSSRSSSGSIRTPGRTGRTISSLRRDSVQNRATQVGYSPSEEAAR